MFGFVRNIRFMKAHILKCKKIHLLFHFGLSVRQLVISVQVCRVECGQYVNSTVSW